MKSVLFFSVALFFSSLVLGQDHFDDIKDLEIELEGIKGKSVEKIIQTIYLFQEKGLDSIDIALLTEGNFLGMLMIKVSNDQRLTYGAIYEEFEQFRKTNLYHKVRQTFLDELALKQLKATNENLPKFHDLLKNQKLSETAYESISVYVSEHLDSTKYYADLLKDYKIELQEVETKNITQLFEVGEDLTYSPVEYLNQSKEQGKPILLYFTGYGCVNCRKLEQMVFKENEVFSLLSTHFIFLPLYVDNNQKLPEKDQYYSKTLRKDVTTIGDKNTELEMQQFKFSAQPLLVCLDSNGTVIGTTDYVKIHKESFVGFLNNCLIDFEKK